MNAVDIQHLTHNYGQRVALADLSLQIAPGEVFGLLGPNGSGKTTLFRVLSTIILPPVGAVKVFGRDVATDQAAVRSLIGVVFQSPSLDKQLTARENLTHHGHLYGLRGRDLAQRVEETLAAFKLADRGRERISTFSGGMRRRVEVAMGLLHRPRLLLMDEPSTGLDPAARIDLWSIIADLRRQGVSVIVTTHLMEEADLCDRLAILEQGKLLACDTPAALKSSVGGDVVAMTSREPERLQQTLAERLGLRSQTIDRTVRLEMPDAHLAVPKIIEAAPGLVESIAVGKPTLQDVFIRLTGRSLAD
ncbi:ABC transporter ATP-binding protein [Humisphaera borealis]|uniref:ABC transporter ATP-binding protein n=1 Tax=Humisphaera borealis TaxID=2807512 RepID=UPI0019D1190D|nr:ABC transporter ATP-binding protein [Humisphaera borealis]